MKDWIKRALKTFVQAFLGTFIVTCNIDLTGAVPSSWGEAWVLIAPAVSAALSAAVCAVWNYILENMEDKA